MHDPDIEALRRPVWRLQVMDFAGPFCCKVDQDTALRVHQALASYETMNWPEIEKRKSCHKTPVHQLCKDARDRLEELALDDVEEIYQLQVTGRARLWGIRDRNILKILWWDPEHQVYPTEKRNT